MRKNILCFGDSNTWGYDPVTKERYPYGIRWTGRLQEKLGKERAKVIAEGLCGRTTVYEDETRPGRKGIAALPQILERADSLHTVILMLGTNDCKTYNHSSSQEIAGGIDQCLQLILEYVSAENVLLISPIHLGENVWQDEYDPEFNRQSVLVSKGLKGEYLKIAKKRGVHFLAAADYVTPSREDQEHLTKEGHSLLAEVIYRKILAMEEITGSA